MCLNVTVKPHTIYRLSISCVNKNLEFEDGASVGSFVMI